MSKHFDVRHAALETEIKHATNFARVLAEGMHNKHYRLEEPDWKVEGDLLGILLQISNMISGLVLEKNDALGRMTEAEQQTDRLARAIEVFYWGVPELHHVAENEFSGSASTQRDNPHELLDFLRARGSPPTPTTR